MAKRFDQTTAASHRIRHETGTGRVGHDAAGTASVLIAELDSGPALTVADSRQLITATAARAR